MMTDDGRAGAVLESSGWLKNGTADDDDVIIGGNVVVVGEGESVFVTAGGGKVVVVGDGESILVAAGNAGVVGDGEEATLLGVSGELSGLGTPFNTSPRTKMRSSSAIDCPRRVPRLGDRSVLALVAPAKIHVHPPHGEESSSRRCLSSAFLPRLRPLNYTFTLDIQQNPRIQRTQTCWMDGRMR